ncbi:cyclodeaminase/cyclohydrolase family protein [Vagococcus elongatus]|uniref:Sugar ABC transporter substrate-binding protein n=1 Tax=Vagococcus elongatus TaxID=180344 RepID=A0A430ANH9_9ENTE|nr:cyclodeaminase/cyclohydrolase family protein [Vagococcus elongatus]RSU09477.1 sugar ABC transporter substrate-binding protein [Vagococcus elongatus]
MKLIDMKVKDFMTVLGSDEPAPGGGSASALAGSMGISLTKMVTELSFGKKKYEEFEALLKEAHEETTQLQASFIKAIDEDTEAFNKVSAVFSMPKETEKEKEERKEAMQQALKGATQTPFEMMEIAIEALNVTKKLIGKSNTNAASDLGVAALNLKSALQGAWLNVLINLSGVKDPAFVEQYQEQGARLLSEGSSLADEIYEAIEKIV